MKYTQEIAVFVSVVVVVKHNCFHATIPVAGVHGSGETEAQAIQHCLQALEFKDKEAIERRD